jgi:hypothetical protein
MPYTVNASVSCPLYSLAPARGARRHRFSVNGRRTTLAQIFSQRRRPCSIWTWQGETSMTSARTINYVIALPEAAFARSLASGGFSFLRLAMSMSRFGLRPVRFGSI